MRKSYIIIFAIILTIILGIVIGFVIANKERTVKYNYNEDEKISQSNNELNNEIEIVYTSIVAAEGKTTPNTLCIFKIYYSECGHTILKKEEILENDVNKTKEEMQKEYKEWKIQDFNSKEITFFKEKTGICNEHYLIKGNNGYVAIYLLDSNEKEILQETTEISIAYLPLVDQEELEKGIRVVGKEKLNATLEDFE